MTVRDTLVQSTIKLIRRDGVAGTGISAVLEHSGVARRSIYLNFPDGKAELVCAAAREAGDTLTAYLRDLAARSDPLSALDEFIDLWKRGLIDSDFEDGCPIVAATLGRAESPEAADLAGEAFANWQNILADALGPDMEDEQRRSLAALVIAAVEGAVIMSRARRSIEPLDQVQAQLAALLPNP
ncbi:MAG: TetR/AcrR family transcriptional regulator [Mycolicibacterium sp.]|uniref:TetR/AcrR family transcriptional regulator n=1 Tax=Mycolicibacterium sp. TaxID=2320850 RepID=UPI003D13F7B7